MKTIYLITGYHPYSDLKWIEFACIRKLDAVKAAKELKKKYDIIRRDAKITDGFGGWKDLPAEDFEILDINLYEKGERHEN